jgi:hypothetical protein
MKASLFNSKKLQSVLAMSVLSVQAFCQDISSVNNALKTETSKITDLLDTVLTVLLIAAFIFMVSNIIFNYTDSKKSYTTFIIVLVLKGMFSILF